MRSIHQLSKLKMWSGGVESECRVGTELGRKVRWWGLPGVSCFSGPAQQIQRHNNNKKPTIVSSIQSETCRYRRRRKENLNNTNQAWRVGVRVRRKTLSRGHEAIRPALNAFPMNLACSITQLGAAATIASAIPTHTTIAPKIRFRQSMRYE
jgi:ribosomal protein L18